MGYAGHFNFHLDNPNRIDFNQQPYKHVVNVTRWVQVALMAESGNDPVVIQFTFNNDMVVIVGERGDFYVSGVNLFLSINFQ